MTNIIKQINKKCRRCGKVIILPYYLNKKQSNLRMYCDNKCRYYRKYNNIYKKKCIICGKIFYKKYFESYKYFKRKKFCDNKCHGRYIKGKFLEEIVGKRKAKELIEKSSGKNSHSYKNGSREYSNTERTRRLIMKMYKGICQICFKKIFGDEKIEGKIMNCHHIHYNSKDKRLKTIVLLHHSCHSKTRANRDYWFAYFCYKLNQKPEEVFICR
jgi:hypothetical protein